MTHTPGEVIKTPRTGAGGAGRRADRSRRARLARGRNRGKGPRSRRPGSVWSNDTVIADEERAGHVRAPGRLTLATSPNYARDIGRRAQLGLWRGLTGGASD